MSSSVTASGSAPRGKLQATQIAALGHLSLESAVSLSSPHSGRLHRHDISEPEQYWEGIMGNDEIIDKSFWQHSKEHTTSLTRKHAWRRNTKTYTTRVPAYDCSTQLSSHLSHGCIGRTQGFGQAPNHLHHQQIQNCHRTRARHSLCCTSGTARTRLRDLLLRPPPSALPPARACQAA